MFHLQDFSAYSSQLFESRTLSWPQRLSDDQNWSTLEAMGFKEVDRATRPRTRPDSFLVEAPDGKLFILTKAGYVRRPIPYPHARGMGISLSLGGADLPLMLIYLMKRYKPYFKRKIGRHPTPEEYKILDQIENTWKAELKARGLEATSGLSEDQVKYLEYVCWGSWSINPTTGRIDVIGDVDLDLGKKKALRFFLGKIDLSKTHQDMGIQFGDVKGSYSTSGRSLTSLQGAPQTVGGDFWCNNNRLTSLVGAPQTVTKNFYCSFNLLTSLAGAPQTVGGDFRCGGNKLSSLGGAPQTVKGSFFCDEFQLSPGQWNPKGWVQVLKEGTPAARRLVLTLPDFGAQFWLNRLKGDLKQDGQTLLQLADLWQSPGWEEEQARLQQELDPGQLRAIQALRGKLAYVDPWQDFKL